MLPRHSQSPRASGVKLLQLLPLALSAAAIAFGSSAYLPRKQEVTDLVLLDWIPAARAPVVIGLHADPISLTFVGLAGVVFTVLLVAAYADRDRAGLDTPVALFQACAILATLGLILSGDTLLLYVLWEVVGVSLHAIDRRQHTPGTFGPYLTSHSSGYGLLLAVLLLARGNSGSFYLAGLDSRSWHWVIVLLMIGAAMGRLAQAWTTNWDRSGHFPLFAIATAGLSSGYLLIRTYSLATSAWMPPFDTFVSVLGAGIAIYGGLRLTGRPRPRGEWHRVVQRSVIVDAGLVVAALGIGSVLGAAAAMAGIIALIVARLPAALGSSTEEPLDPADTGVGIAVGTLAVLPPLLTFAARWLLCLAAIGDSKIVLLLLVVAAGAIETRAIVMAASQSRLLAAALDEAARTGPDAEPEAELPEAFADVDPDAPAEAEVRTRAGGLAGPNLALLVLCLPLAVLTLVPALLASLTRPALATMLGEAQAGAAVRFISAGPSLPALIAVLVSLTLGVVLATTGQPRARQAAARRSRSLLASRRRSGLDSDDPRLDLVEAPVPAALDGIGRGLAQLAVAIEDRPYIAAILGTIVVVLLALVS